MLSGMPSVAVYLDDILVSSRSEEEHLKILDEVLHRLQEAGLKVRASKCQFMMPKVEYLGHLIDKDCIRPTPAKVSAIKNAPAPTTVKELLCILGMVTYYSKYLPFRAVSFLSVAPPLLLDSTSKITIYHMPHDFHVVFLKMTSCDLAVTLTSTYFKHHTLLDCSPAVKKRFGRVWVLYC